MHLRGDDNQREDVPMTTWFGLFDLFRRPPEPMPWPAPKPAEPEAEPALRELSAAAGPVHVFSGSAPARTA